MVAIIDYGVGNLFSVEKALVAAGAEAQVTNDAETIRQAERIVLPGVGAFGDCMREFKNSGLVEVLKERVREGVPLLGICVGLQILFEDSEESPGVPGLGILKGHVKKIKAPGLKVPHMGWNSLEPTSNSSGLWQGLAMPSYVYFVHSYHAVPDDKAIVTAVAQYGTELTAAVCQGNIYATQFHPEKSGDVGLQILKNFNKGL